jgi:large subunit ribosomal protein L1
MLQRQTVGATMEIKKALEELRKGKKRKFSQTVELVVNLRGIDLKKDNINVIATVPNKVKSKRVCAFLTKKSELVDTITEPEFKKYSEKNFLKKLVKDYDFFIAHGSLMPKVATNFGKVLGPAGKMPSPQLGILMSEEDSAVKGVLEKIGKALKVRAKEASLKLTVGKEDMEDEKIMENVGAVYRAVENALPNKRENVKNVLLKFTMTKPVKVDIK